MNELHLSQSPYLLQHQDNPVHWKQWNQENLSINKDQLIIISIGYSSCHWCHVMAHECFEDHEVAQLMNEHFVNFKIDREEQPDIDAIYMNALQLMTRQGGWPLNIVALPNGYPIWGCTYLPKSQWMHQLNQLQKLYNEDKERVLEYADQLHQHLHLSNQLDLILDHPSKENHEELYNKWISTFDYDLGGINRAPKFILPTHWNLLFQYEIDDKISTYIHNSLQTIQKSGIHDVIEGGFYRYSVDHYWHIPHFEKMLYDQGQLISVYIQAYLKYKDETFLSTALSIVDFVNKNWKSDQGGYYGSYDADSLDNHQHAEEGYYYVLSQEDIEKLPKQNFSFIKDLWNISSTYIWENKYIHLHQTEAIEKIASKHNLSIEEAQQVIANYKEAIKRIRKTKSKPNLDTKRITSWNALFLSGMIDLYLTKNSVALEESCEQLFQYLSQHCINENGQLIHTDSLMDQNPLLEDYAFVIQSFFKYYQMTFDAKVLHLGKQLLDAAIDLFYDDTQQFFASHLATESHIVSQFEIEDNVISSSNSIMCDNLFLASILYSNPRYKSIAEFMLDKVTKSVDSFSVYSQWYTMYYKWNTNFKYLIAKDYTKKELFTLHAHFSDYNLFIIDHNISLPIGMDYSIMKEKEIQICNRTQCFLKVSNINSIINK